jgi:hypothetical protein
MKMTLTALAGGLLIAIFAAAYAKLPPPTPEQKAAAAATAEKQNAEKAKAAKELEQAQDRAVANYRKHKGGSSSGGATAQPEPPQGAKDSKARLPDSELTRHEAQNEMPKPGQVNDYSTPARDPQNSSPSR